MDWSEYVRYDQRYLRPLDVGSLIGDSTKAKRKLGWDPKVKFETLIKLMVGEDLKRWERWQNGERFPWDAPSYPDENQIISRYVTIDK